MTCAAALLLVMITSIGHVELKRYHSIAGPYRIVMKHMGQCEVTYEANKNELIYVQMKEFHNHRDPEVMYNGTFYLPYAVTDDTRAVLSIATWNGVKGWQENAHTFHVKSLCFYVQKMFPSVWNRFLMGCAGEVFPCPYLAGFYRFENVKILSNDLPVKHFFYGRWRARLRIYLGSATKECGCVEAFADTVPV